MANVTITQAQLDPLIAAYLAAHPSTSATQGVVMSWVRDYVTAHPPGPTTAQVQQMIADAIAQIPPGLTTAQVQQMISDALGNVTPTPTPTPSVGNGIKIPAGVRLRGTNIVQSFGHIGPQDNGNGWQAEWRNFQWDSWWKPQIDDAATVGNAVRIWGGPQAVANGSITLATYLAEFKQVLDYCASKGLYVYPTANVLGFTKAQADTILAPWSAMLKQYSNIIGVDQSNETFSAWWSGDFGGGTQANLDLVQYFCDTIRTNSGLPVSNSFPLTDSGQWTWDGGNIPLAALFEMSDFLDYHVYAASTPAQVQAGLAMPWAAGKRMIIGEYGRNMTATDRVALYTNIATLVKAVPQIDAALNWSCWDLNGSDPNWQFGLFDGNRHLRTDIATPFATMPTTA